jgi:hypothetical protein
MNDIQDFKDRIFSESKNIISALDRIEHVNVLIEKQDLVNELAEKISFLKILQQKLDFYNAEETQISNENEVVEEEAIFNNQLNEIDGAEMEDFSTDVFEEEAIFNNQLNEIVETELHEAVVNFSKEFNEEKPVEALFEDKIETAKDVEVEEPIEEEADFNNQLNEINEFENVVSEEATANNFEEEEKLQQNINNEAEIAKEVIPSIFDVENPVEEILVEENEGLYKNTFEEGEMMSETSNIDQVIAEIKSEKAEEIAEATETLVSKEDSRKIVNFEEKEFEDNENHPSDKSFEDLEKYHQEKKIKLANFKGLKAIQTLFDDDPLEREMIEPSPKAKLVEIPEKKEETGTLLKNNLPTTQMEAEKAKPKFKLDLNDRIAFTKTLFGGSQSELIEVVNNLNSFKDVESAKEYLRDLYYAKKWDKVDEYAQRLWILVENRFS